MKKIVLCVVVCVTVSFFLIKEIKGNNSQPGSGVSNQYYCSLGYVYTKENDLCVPLFASPATLLEDSQSTRDTRKISVVFFTEAKRGDSCISLTGRSQKPLSSSDCYVLAKVHGRLAHKSSKYFMNKKMQPVIHIGEEWFLVEVDNGSKKFLEWKIPPKV